MRRSSSDIDRLIADLESSDSIHRDAAVARLRILGRRALPRLIDLISAHQSSDVRAIALDALEGLDDVRVIDVAFHALRDGSVEVVIAALEHLFKADVDPATVACLVLEPVQGEGGFLAMPPDYPAKLQELCSKYGILWVNDEVQSGVGRTGAMWAIGSGMPSSSSSASATPPKVRWSTNRSSVCPSANPNRAWRWSAPHFSVQVV